MRQLFIGGPGRSGTTALADYLNEHEEILICRERYKFVHSQVNPSLFTFERILDYREGETNLPRQYHVDLLARKDPEKLKWIGDKHPAYVRSLDLLERNNPGARFILTYRAIEEVAESYDSRSKNPADGWLGGLDGFDIGVRSWNPMMRKVREFIEKTGGANCLIISYHDFFYRNEACIPLLSNFLEIEFDDSIRTAWREASTKFEKLRRRKAPLTEEQIELVEEHRDYALEEWILERIASQWEELGLPVEEAPDFRSPLEEVKARRVRNLEKKLHETEQRARKLDHRLTKQHLKIRHLQRRNQLLNRKILKFRKRLQEMRNSRMWKLVNGVSRIRARFIRR